jgi:hypothetical protein
MTNLMHVDYEVSEKDFLEAQKLAIKKSPFRLVRWIRWVLPLIGLMTLAFLAYAVATQGIQGQYYLGIDPAILDDLNALDDTPCTTETLCKVQAFPRANVT